MIDSKYGIFEFSGILFHKELRFGAEILDFKLRSYFLFFCFSVFMIFPLNAREVELKVQEVTLYESSAGVLRSGKINLEPGINELMIRNLPVALQDESLVASVETAGASVVGSSTWIETGAVIRNEEALELQKKIRALEKEIEDYESRNSNFRNLRKILVDTRLKLTEMISKNLFYKKTRSIPKSGFKLFPEIDKQFRLY
ncbi:PF13600 domain protein [Leptospira weilii serovar Topaz str. LT2116]|uniref:PF13600 domain protein n=1 Tax=Leptospira weilii serovar Topaz str. LT2116 TaxID=1088540 RepID=M3G6V2_9LEPT|nr:PF13600 domain protein [Leptospira weilii serovar Topaz str. LT2116]